MNGLKASIAPLLLGLALGAAAHEGAKHAPKKDAEVRKEQKEWGIAGGRSDVNRTIHVVMSDRMRFTPQRIEVLQGETIRFVHRNTGKAVHEFVLGTKKELDEHAALMRKFPGMEHDEPYMAHVSPGKSQEMVWTFNRPGTFDFGCLIPGHYEAGMVGQVIVRPKDDGKARQV